MMRTDIQNPINMPGGIIQYDPTPSFEEIATFLFCYDENGEVIDLDSFHNLPRANVPVQYGHSALLNQPQHYGHSAPVQHGFDEVAARKAVMTGNMTSIQPQYYEQSAPVQQGFQEMIQMGPNSN